MTVILVLALFVVCLVVERFTNHKAPEYALQTASFAVSEAPKPKVMVAGFEIPEHLYLHRGHAWAVGESAHLVRAGIDDFAAKLIGKASEVNLPQRGQWVRQGQKVWSFRVNGELVEMVSPIEGTVSDVNDEVVRHPEMLTADPYGDCWLMAVDSPDAKTNFRNLLGGAMARSLIAESAKKLAAYMPSSAGSPALAQDGGTAHAAIGKMLAPEKYKEAAREFFLV